MDSVLNDIFVSMIIPVYQAADTLEKCVLSCMEQKDINPEELEIILVDDGSTDGSSKLCDKLAEADELKRIHVCHTENGGVSHARNVGIEMAKGQFIAFVDSDDRVSDKFVSNVFKHADESVVLIDETVNTSGTMKISGFQYIENDVLNENTHVWGKLFRRETLEEGHIRFQEGLTIGEDLLFLLDLALFVGKTHGIKCISDDDYYYAVNENSVMNRAFKESYLDQIVCWRQAEERLLTVRNNLSPYSFVSVAVSQILTALLVAGKVATQGESRDSELDKKALSLVSEQIDHALKTRGAYAALSMGHKIKVVIYRRSPQLYVKLYSKHKGA